MRCEFVAFWHPHVALRSVFSWGYPFLYESYLYHVHRLDHRHNFSPYFYLIYLTYPTHQDPAEALMFWRTLARSPLTSFVPQMALTLGAGVLFGRQKKDMVFAWFVQTFVFVIMNKVCTSQVCGISCCCACYIMLSNHFSTSCGTRSSCRSSFQNCRCRGAALCSLVASGSARKPCGSARHTNWSSLGRTCSSGSGSEAWSMCLGMHGS